MKKLLIILVLICSLLSITSCSCIDKIIDGFQYDDSLESVYSFDELVEKYDEMTLLMDTERSYNLRFVHGTINTIANYIDNKSLKLINYSASFSLTGGVLTIKIRYPGFGYETTDDPGTILLGNACVVDYQQTRSDDYDNFSDGKWTKSFSVNNSETLYYCLQEHMKPIIDSSNEKMIKLYEGIKDILRKVVSDDMDDLTKCLVLYEYLINNIKYDYELLNFGSRTDGSFRYDGYYLEGAVFNQKCVCAGYSKLYCSLLNLEGIDAIVVNGKTVKNNEGHSWNKVCLDGKWYVVDVTNGGTTVDNRCYLNHNFFLKTDDEYGNYAVANVNELKYYCHTKFDTYQYLKYKDNDLKIESYNEFKTLVSKLIIDRFNPFASAIIDVKITYKMSSIEEELKKVCNDLHYYGSYSYINVSDSYLLIF